MLIVQHLPLADHIIILDDKGEIAEQGTWEELRAEAGYISKVVLKEMEAGENKARDRTEARDKLQVRPEQPDSNMQDITRKTGDVALYSTLPSYPRRIPRVTDQRQATTSAPLGLPVSSSSRAL
jgi:ABC-type multidrug transport system ATPase subunit